MSKFNIGDKVKITTSDKTGTVRAVYESGYWNISDSEYSIEFDDGSGIITIVERIIERIGEYEEPKCECGVGSVNGNKHSYYCPLYGRNA